MYAHAWRDLQWRRGFMAPPQAVPQNPCWTDRETLYDKPPGDKRQLGDCISGDHVYTHTHTHTPTHTTHTCTVEACVIFGSCLRLGWWVSLSLQYLWSNLLIYGPADRSGMITPIGLCFPFTSCLCLMLSLGQRGLINSNQEPKTA